MKRQWTNGKFISEKQEKQKISQIAVGKSKKKVILAKDEEKKEKRTVCSIEGSRIIDIKILASHMWCAVCKQVLSLNNIELELRKGLGSIFKV